MFFSRPKIEPLGWDLTSLPLKSGYDLYGTTTDNRPVYFHFDNGCISARIGSAGTKEAEETIIESVMIAPVGYFHIHPIQLCEVLGLTVNGKPPNLANISPKEIDFDFSGKTAYWACEYLRVFESDMREFITELADSYQDCVLIQQTKLGYSRRHRQIPFVSDTDDSVIIGIGPNQELLKHVLAADKADFEGLRAAFDYIIYCAQGKKDKDPLNPIYKMKRANETRAREIGLKFQLADTGFAVVSTEYEILDQKASDYTDTLLSLVKKSFFVGGEYVDLQTGRVMTQEANICRYSRQVKKWCLDVPDRYLKIGVETPQSREVSKGNSFGKGDETIFYGVRPLK